MASISMPFGIWLILAADRIDNIKSRNIRISTVMPAQMKVQPSSVCGTGFGGLCLALGGVLGSVLGGDLASVLGGGLDHSIFLSVSFISHFTVS